MKPSALGWVGKLLPVLSCVEIVPIPWAAGCGPGQQPAVDAGAEAPPPLPAEDAAQPQTPAPDPEDEAPAPKEPIPDAHSYCVPVCCRNQEQFVCSDGRVLWCALSPEEGGALCNRWQCVGVKCL